MNKFITVNLIFIFIASLCVFLPDPAQAQLRELEIKQEPQPESIPVFRNHPDEAAVIIYSSLTNLNISSNMVIVADQSRPDDGRYVLLVGPYRQILTIRAPGFQETRINVPNVSAREVAYFSVEPKNPEPVEGRGTLVLRSIPDGARITVDGYPDLTRQTPNTFELPAQSYRFRLELDRYEPKELIVTIPDGQVLSRFLELVPNYGFVTIPEQGNLRVRFEGEQNWARVTFTPNKPMELPVGQHELELRREFYNPERALIKIRPGEEIRWEPQLRPLYGRLRVRANTSVELLIEDNHVPPVPRNADYLHIETGRRLVRVTAPNHITRNIAVNVPPGGLVDTTVTLMTLADAEDLRRREQQPRGVIRAAADLADTEIWIDGEKAGRGFTNQTVITGDYTVEFRHDIGTRTRSVHVPPAGLEEVVVQMRPSRGKAIRSSLLFPGRGHTYTGRSRGYIYSGAFWLSAVGSAAIWFWYDSIDSDFQNSLSRYQNATNLQAAAHHRGEVLRLHDDRLKAYQYFEYAVYVTAAIYALNMLDILVTRPPFGYRSGKPPEGFSLGVIPGPAPTPSPSLTWRHSF